MRAERVSLTSWLATAPQLVHDLGQVPVAGGGVQPERPVHGGIEADGGTTGGSHDQRVAFDVKASKRSMRNLSPVNLSRIMHSAREKSVAHPGSLAPRDDRRTRVMTRPTTGDSTTI